MTFALIRAGDNRAKIVPYAQIYIYTCVCVHSFDCMYACVSNLYIYMWIFVWITKKKQVFVSSCVCVCVRLCVCIVADVIVFPKSHCLLLLRILLMLAFTSPLAHACNDNENVRKGGQRRTGTSAKFCHKQ